MEDKGKRQTLTLVRRPLPPVADGGTLTLQRKPKKRVLLREDLEAAKQSGTVQIKNKPKKKPKKRPPKVIKPAPSIDKAKELDDLLKRKCRTWRDYKPITRDKSFQREIYKLALAEGVYFSKVLVAGLVKKHCNDKRYIARVVQGGKRLDFFGKEAETIINAEQTSAGQKLAALIRIPN